ncbi:MAG: hypothetical protein JWN33_365 [Candidatus Saccharibacteria bacterium]|nr:hypothetical protein [Candidatus Saccharibacteria bacterium]
MRRRRAGIVGLSVSLVVLAFAGWLVLNRQYAVDQVSVWVYKPSAAVAAIDQRLSLTEKGKFYFHTTQPAVDAAAQFNESCPQQEAGSAILGCYTTGRIHIYDVPNEQLDGIEDVTAAHEMLHAAWERLDTAERDRIGKLLVAQYETLNDPDLKERIDYYQRNEPGQLINELHSIIGTEQQQLSPELENYYARYFVHRAGVYELYSSYATVFKDLKTRSEALYAELTSLEKQISGASDAYENESKQFTTDITSFNQRARSGGFSSSSQYNAERRALLARQNQLEADRLALNAMIDTYNTKFNEYQTLAFQSEQLNRSIDSTVAPAPTVE